MAELELLDEVAELELLDEVTELELLALELLDEVAELELDEVVELELLGRSTHSQRSQSIILSRIRPQSANAIEPPHSMKWHGEPLEEESLELLEAHCSDIDNSYVANPEDLLSTR